MWGCGRLLGAAVGTLIYWYLLYHTHWAYGLALFSVGFFVIAVIARVVTALIALFAAMVGSVVVLTDEDCGALGCCILSLIVGLVGLIVVIDLGIAIYGLSLSLHLLHSGASMCPIEGDECGWLVALFFVTLLMSMTKTQKIEVAPQEQQGLPTTDPHYQVPQQRPPAYTAYGRARVLAAPFIFDPRSNAACQPLQSPNVR